MAKIRQDTGRIWSWLRGARVAGLSAAAGLVFLSFGGGLEETYGLGTLFRVRGPLPAPSQIVVVAIDRASAESLGLPPPPTPWPRTIQAELVGALDKRGATAIVFDQYFTMERSAVEDQEFAAALRLSGRVVLLQDLVRRVTPEDDKEDGPKNRASDLTIDPIAPLRDAALAMATFPVPTDPDMPLTSFWTFLSGTDLPTLPSVALQLSAAGRADDWAAILRTEGVGPRDPQAWTDKRATESMTQLRAQLKDDAAVVNRLAQAIGRLEADKAKPLSALLDLYSGEDSRQLNFFGPPWTISTIPYASIINGDEGIADLRGKIVFVGASDRESLRQLDTYRTPYPSRDGINVSGVEILATSMANLRDSTSLRTAAAVNILIVVLVALVLGLAAASASDLVLGIVSVTLLLVIPALAYTLFVSVNFVAPLVAPLAVQLPVGILTIGLSLKSAERRLRRGLENAARQFLPWDVADRLAMGPLSPSAMPASRIVSAIFLATDVKGFTTLAERLSPETLDGLAKDYFGPLFEAVTRHRGDILNMTADSMMCAWPLGEGEEPANARVKAIAAALNMARLVEDFATRHPSTPMPTRLGLRAGTAAFGVVGHSGRYVTTVVGDVTNTASRIDSLNKLLNTTVLASAEVLSNVEGLLVRPLGAFAPLGKTESVEVVEILGYGGEDQRLTALAGAFSGCIAAFNGEEWSDAAKRFGALREQYPDDGPTAFFHDLAARYSQDPPPAGTARPIRVNIK